MLQILQQTQEPAKKTHILYRTRINHEQLSRYVRLLLDHGMIEPVSRPFDGYLITENGRVLLELFKLDSRQELSS